MFSLGASVALKRVAGFALVAAALDIVLRPAIHAMFSPSLSLDPQFLARWIRPEDLPHAGVFGALWVLDHVLESAAALADEAEHLVRGSDADRRRAGRDGGAPNDAPEGTRAAGRTVRAAGVDEQQVSMLPSDEARGVRFDTLEKICATLDCHPGDLPVFRSPTSP